MERIRLHARLLTIVGLGTLVGAIGMLAWLHLARTREARSWVTHTYDVLATAKDFRIALLEAESGQRGYLITGQDSYLAPYRAALARVTDLQEALRRLTADNRAQQDRLEALLPMVLEKLEIVTRAVDLRALGETEAALDVVRTDTGHRAMRLIIGLLDSFTEEERILLGARFATLERAEETTRWLAMGGTVLGLLLLLAAARATARTQAQVAVAEAEQRSLAAQLHTTVESIGQGLAVFSRGHLLTRWNAAFASLLTPPGSPLREGLPYRALAGTFDTAAQDGGPLLESEEQVAADHAAPAKAAYYSRTRADDGRAFEIRRTPMPDGGFVLTVTDVTQRVRADAALRETQRLTAIGQLTGGIAHDFNNLLAVILGNLELSIRKLGESHEVRPRLQRAAWAVTRGAELTQRLLAFARQQPLVPQSTDLAALLPNLTAVLRSTLGEAIDIRTAEEPELWPAMVDPTQVETAVVNLALNARDAMPEGGRLTIELANRLLDEEYANQNPDVAPGDYVMLAVSDTGSGMTPDVAARAFEPFFTTKGVGQGTGLGLAMVFGFLKQSGGHVQIHSEPGEGTTVRMYLPRAVAPAMPLAPLASAGAELPRGTETLLMVEDEPAVREVSAAILRDLGYTVLEAGDGQEALRVFGQHESVVDLLLADIVLPGSMKGDEVARRITAVRPEIKVLFMSGYTENAIVHRGRLDPGVQLLGKPFQREQLARHVARVLHPAHDMPGGRAAASA